MQISHSAQNRLSFCPRSYKLYYIDKIRPTAMSSALVFGNALDDAFNELLLNRDLDKALSIFNEKWLPYRDDLNISFYKSDLMEELLTEEDLLDMSLITNDELRLHRAFWYSMKQKGIRMVAAYHHEILPRIKNVITVQKDFKIHGYGSDGLQTEDYISGKIDLIADIELADGTVVTAVLDNKTTSEPYPKKSYEKKAQTALYAAAENNDMVGFLTVNKKTFATQILVGKVPVEKQEEVLGSFLDSIEQVKSGEFPGIEKKKCWQFSKRCEYYDYCWNGSMKGLVEKK
jgi:CRISPR/Cas system-associated exonuclease Cas4 (RecB family)